MSQARSQNQVIKAWQDMELFSPQTVKKAAPADQMFPSINWRSGMPLPWQSGSYLARRNIKPGHVWRHTVYLWIYDLTAMYECLDHIYAPILEAHDARPLGQSAAACFSVDEHGRLIPDSIVLSSAAWGLGRALRSAHRHDHWFTEFTKASKTYIETVTELVELDTHDPEDSRFITPELLLHLGRLTRTATGLPRSYTFAPPPGENHEPATRDPLPVATIARIQSRAINPDNDDYTSDFLNSFILEDLARAATAIDNATASPTLTTYLAGAAGHEPPHRTDTVTTPHKTYPAISPAAMPYGRWPTNPAHSLATSQQLAVNLSLRDLRENTRTLRSVNGPPGTGKTTLLRDVFAGLVVERARRLAALDHPRDAFTGEKKRWRVGDYTRIVHLIHPELTGFEMVVTSSNNKAVENISDELPATDSIAETWKDADYLRDIATHVRRCNNNDTDAWGMIAARLGNRSNRRAFADAFWTNKRQWENEPKTFRYFLENASSNPTASWDETVHAFRDALERVDELIHEASCADKRIKRTLDLQQQLHTLEKHEAELTQHHHYATEHHSETTRAHDIATAQLDHANAHLAEHQRSRPGWWKTLVTFGAARRAWHQSAAPLRIAAEAAATAHARTLEASTNSRERLVRLHSDVVGAQKRQARCREEIAELAVVTDRDRRRWGAAYPDAAWFEDERSRELTAPWSEAALNRARSEVFLAALRLHRVWFEQCATGEAGEASLVQSMRAVMDVVRGDVPEDVDPCAVLAAWQTFFLVVPVVSTTFASFGRMFSHVGSESLGWVFIDEAGQATPQAAVGALWRAQRALVVGDPLQLTPIVTLPTKAEANIAGVHQVPDCALPSLTSAQGVADRCNSWGTWLGSGDERLWVGTPLRVHRRCDEPMFTISNTVAYGGLMIQGKQSRSYQLAHGEEVVAELPESCWLHVPAAAGSGHALRDDLAIAEQLTRNLLDGAAPTGAAAIPADEIIVISPFRDMAEALRRFPDRLGKPVRAGTVHTAQGQEAQAVLFVLGGDPSKPGARHWAAATPNLVNVAASRAATRLYVVGDHRAWSGLPHVATMASYLPCRSSTPQDPWGLG
ncbi:DEAD/DEAH box helicase [Dermatophilus congolensis]|nr:AAA domain-containing protein [Dermatophilus congolensis]